ncbi:MAG: leucyl/phenylalanyl-tRNA--protein transferase [Wenzhouxiangellaceae bacterium]
MNPLAVPALDPSSTALFPDPCQSSHPDGLIAIGGDLSRQRLLNAYRNGIFPWYESGGPILWWSPDPRAVFILGHTRTPKRLMRTLRNTDYNVTINQAFDQVIEACAAPRGYTSDTWLTREMIDAYVQLHQAGDAHSLEVHIDGELAGGVYGIAIGNVFFAESKFHRKRDASKIALAELFNHLQAAGYLICDCQLWNPHLEQFGVRMMDRSDFVRAVRHLTARTASHPLMPIASSD